MTLRISARPFFLQPQDHQAPGAATRRVASEEPCADARRNDSIYHGVKLRWITTRHGERVTFPYQNYDAKGLALYGLADLNVLRTFMNGSGYQPIATDGNKGIVTLWVMEYKDTNLGTYREVVATIAATKTARTVPYKDPYSLLVPTTEERMTSFAFALILDTQVAVDVGREQMGLDKHLGKVAIMDHGDHRALEVRDQNGQLVVQGSSTIDRGLGAKWNAFKGLVRNIGLLDTVAASARQVVENDLVTFDVRKPGAVVVNPSKSRAATTLNPVAPSDTLAFGTQSELGRALATLRFEPKMVYAADHIKTGFSEPE